MGFEVIFFILIGVTALFIWGAAYRIIRLMRNKENAGFMVHKEILLHQLQLATGHANEIMTLLPQVGDVELAAYYENATQLLENLLILVKQNGFSERDPVNLKSALYLAQNCVYRMERVHQAYELALKGKAYNLKKLCNWQLKQDASIRGCYFCSRPHLDGSFRLVKVRIDGKPIKVASCASCAELLDQKETVKILHFRRDGKLVHWSEVKEYKPEKDFWTIRSQGIGYKKPKLTLLENKPLVEDEK
jgi:hypothetical protein